MVPLSLFLLEPLKSNPQFNMLKGQHIYLRALEPGDVDLLYRWENDASIWHLGHTLAPISKLILKEYLSNSQQDIYSLKQLRLVICRQDKAVGCVDLFDFDPQHLKAGIGILIADQEDRRKGYASETIQLMKVYAKEKLNLHQLYCTISNANAESIHLFESNGFSKSGDFKDWLRVSGKFERAGFYQCIL